MNVIFWPFGSLSVVDNQAKIYLPSLIGSGDKTCWKITEIGLIRFTGIRGMFNFERIYLSLSIACVTLTDYYGIENCLIYIWVNQVNINIPSPF